jgi:hypothetical protein
MPRDFYPFVENADGENEAQGTPKTSTDGDELKVKYPARIAVYDDAAAAPRVVLVEPKDVRSYLEEITATVTRLSKEQGGSIPFMVIREIVENFIHAYFLEPTISILDGGETIKFSDQGPGIKSKELALEYGTTSATEPMKQYIRGVGSGLPYVQQYMTDRGGSLTIEDNISGGTIVTISNVIQDDEQMADQPMDAQGFGMGGMQGQGAMGMQAAPAAQGYGMPTAMPGATGAVPQMPQGNGMQQYGAIPYGQAAYPQGGFAPGWPQYQQMPMQQGMPYQQQGQYQPYMQPQQPIPAQQPVPFSLSERDVSVLSYLKANPTVGPTELTRSFGSSQPTWTRELQKLEKAGFIRKNKGAQKYALTDLGRTYARQL